MENNNNNNVNVVAEEQDLGEQMRIRREKLTALQERGDDPFAKTKFVRDAYSQDIISNFEDYDTKTVTIAGRIMSKRVMGKASFAHVLDSKGKIQIYVKVDNLGVDEYADFKKLDIGDIVGVKGFVFMTHKAKYR